jgi:hypothetical protein
MSLIALIALAFPSSFNAETAVEPSLTVRLAQNDPSLAPSTTAFGSNGDLYVAYRARGTKHQSSAVWLRLFDSKTGRELRQAQIKAPVVELPQRPSMLQVSSDGNLLLYVETPSIVGPNRGIYIAVVDALTFRLISSTDLGSLTLSNSRVFGFGADGQSIVLGSSTQRTGHEDVTESIRVIEIKARDLKQIVHDESTENPFDSYGYTIDDTGSLWLSENPSIAKSFAKYDPSGKTIVREISVGGDYGASTLLFLHGSVLGFTHEASQDSTFGRIVRFESGRAEPVRTERISGCGFKQAAASPDQLFVAGICDEQNQAELNFGALNVCNVVVLQAETLQVLATIPQSKRTTWHLYLCGMEMAKSVWRFPTNPRP